jgi:hypothetical protein
VELPSVRVPHCAWTLAADDLLKSVPESAPKSNRFIHQHIHQNAGKWFKRWKTCGQLPSCSEARQEALPYDFD